MDEDALEALEEFVSGPLATWMQTLETLVGGRPAQRPQGEEELKEYFLNLIDGDFLFRIVEMIDLIPGGMQSQWRDEGQEGWRLEMLATLLRRLQSFYKNELHQLILSPLPNLHLLARKPFTAQGVQEMKKLILLLLGGAVQCEHCDVFIGQIQSLDIGVQAALASAIEEVSREPENILGLHWRETDPPKVGGHLLARVQELVSERDAALEQLWELQQKPETPPSPHQHSDLRVQLAEVRAQARRLQGELDRKMEELLDQQEESKDLEHQVEKMQQENRQLVGEARLARLYQDELDSLREKALKAERLQSELMALKERLPAFERCMVQLKEEREFSEALLKTKTTMEKELLAAHARGQHLNQLEKETQNLRNCLNQLQEERNQLSHQTEELLKENWILKKQLREGLENSLNVLLAEELSLPWDTNECPVALDCEIKEAGRRLACKRENREQHERWQEGAEPEKLEADSKTTVPVSTLEQSQAEKQSSVSRGHAPGVPEHETPFQAMESQALKRDAKPSAARMEAHMPEVQTLLQEAEWRWEAESRRADHLEERLGSLQGAHAEARAECERWRSETEHLMEEIRIVEREKESLTAGAQVLQAAAAQAEMALSHVQHSLQDERLQGTRLTQQAQRAEEALAEARQELEALQHSLEQHQGISTRLEAEKAALEEALSHSERRRQHLDKEGQRLKASTQAQEKALDKQGCQLALLEAQSRQQAAELSSLQGSLRRLGELEQEGVSLRRELAAKSEAIALLEEELGREKAKPKERLSQAEALWMETSSRKEQAGGHANEENTLLRRFEELHHLKERRVENQEEKALDASILEEHPLSFSTEGENPLHPDLLPSQASVGGEHPNARLDKLVCKDAAALQAEKAELVGPLGQLESLASSLETVLLGLRGQNADGKEESEKRQAHSNALQVEVASLRFQQTLLERQLLEAQQRLKAQEAEVCAARQERDGWRERHEGLQRDHDRLLLLHERQGGDLERLLGEQATLKGALRSLEKEQRELEGRQNQLLGQKDSLERREAALQGQRERLEEAERRHLDLAEQAASLKEEQERMKHALVQTEQARDGLQSELQGMRNRLMGLQLEQTRLQAESTALREQNQQLDTALGRLSTQCELLAQLKGNQEEENRHLLQEIQLLSRENRWLLERSMESREHFQQEQRQYQDKLSELRREKQKLVEKIMDQYRVLDPALPRGKKNNWIADKIRKLMKLRREALPEQLRPRAEGAGSSESLAGQEDRGTNSPGSSSPNSPARLQKASSTLSIPDSQPVHFRHCRLSSRMPAAADCPGSREGEAQDTPRQRFRQRRLGMLGGSREEAAVAAAQPGTPDQRPASSEEERGPPLGEEDQTSNCPS